VSGTVVTKSKNAANAAEAGAGTSAIFAKDLGKAYRMYDKPIHRLWELLVPGLKKHREFWAVRNVYLDIPRGSTVGIIGENGAGKSTLLKLLTGITLPTTGEVRVNGRISSLLELGAGFHPEFSGRDNIYLNCSVLGMSDAEIAERFPKIVEFSELGDFIERPVKTYSSGMYVRLGFAVASSVDPDILMIDEALSVGDEHFKGKCINRLNEFREQGKTTIFVSHDMGAVKSMCQHVILMDKGEVLEQGSAEKVADEYLKRAHARGNERLSTLNRDRSAYPRWGSGEIETLDIEMLDAGRKQSLVFRTGEPFVVRIRFRVHRKVKNPVFGVGIYRSDGTYVNGSNHHWREHPILIEEMDAGEEGDIEMAFGAMPLLHGQYYLTTFVYDHSKAAPTAIDHREHAVTFEVLDARRHQHGMLYLPTLWTLYRRAPGRSEEKSAESRS
jgi:ABC-type polysaccharide/polyol phosphate transport system ATPase subunit